MKIPKQVRLEIQSVLDKPNGTRSLRYRSNFTDYAWQYVSAMSWEELFNEFPPKQLATKGKKSGKYNCQCLRCGKPTRFISYTVGYTAYCDGSCGLLDWTERETKKERRNRMRKQQNTMTQLYGAHCSVLAGIQSADQLHTPAAKRNQKRAMFEKYGRAGNRTAEQQAFVEACVSKQTAGFRHTLLTKGIQRRNMYQRKTLRILGHEFQVQGYEYQVLEYLVQSGRVSVETVTTVVPGVPYVEHGKQRVYVPDFRAKLSNRWTTFEVKSTYTAGLHTNGKTMFYNLRRKSRAAAEAGHRILTVIYDNKCDEFVEIFNIHEYSIAEVRKLFDPNLFTFA